MLPVPLDVTVQLTGVMRSLVIKLLLCPQHHALTFHWKLKLKRQHIMVTWEICSIVYFLCFPIIIIIMTIESAVGSGRYQHIKGTQQARTGHQEFQKCSRWSCKGLSFFSIIYSLYTRGLKPVRPSRHVLRSIAGGDSWIILNFIGGQLVDCDQHNPRGTPHSNKFLRCFLLPAHPYRHSPCQ